MKHVRVGKKSEARYQIYIIWEFVCAICLFLISERFVLTDEAIKWNKTRSSFLSRRTDPIVMRFVSKQYIVIILSEIINNKIFENGVENDRIGISFRISVYFWVQRLCFLFTLFGNETNF